MRNLAILTAGVLLFVGVTLGGPATAAAQARQFGAKVGPSFSTLAIQPAESEGYRIRGGASGGGFLVLPLTPWVAVQFEGLYMQKGGKLDAPEFNETATVLLDYIDFPVLLRLNGPATGRTAFHVFAGPAAGIRTTAKRQLSYSGGGFTSGIAMNMVDEIKRFDLSVVAGAGLEITPHIVIDGRYSWGVRDVNRDTTGGLGVRTRVLAFMAGVRF